MRFNLIRKALISGILLLLLTIPLSGQEVRLSGEAEERARVLFQQLRCAVCQNQSIDDSNADVAKDLRKLVREQLQAGKSNDQIIDHLVARYGEFILLKPKFALHTLLLWLTPVLLIIFGIISILIWSRRKKESPLPLTKDEQEKFAEIMARNTGVSE